MSQYIVREPAKFISSIESKDHAQCAMLDSVPLITEEVPWLVGVDCERDRDVRVIVWVELVETAVEAPWKRNTRLLDAALNNAMVVRTEDKVDNVAHAGRQLVG